ncbi:MAG: response regulator [Anaerolineae bacterium]
MKSVFTPKRILIITNAMKFALNVKKALENNGYYEVAVFSSGKAGVDHVRKYSQNVDIAVIDFRMKDMPGTDMVDHVRAMHPDIIVIAAPDHPAIHDLKERHNIQEIINLPVSIRRFANVLQSVTTDIPTQRQSRSSDKANQFSVSGTSQMLEFWVSNRIDGSLLIQADAAADEPALSPESSATFKRLAAEEPPMPAFADGSTIKDLRAKLTNIEEIQRTLAATVEEDTETSEPFLIDDADQIPAARILDATVGESTPLPIFSNDEFEQRVKESGISGIQALFTWKREGERYVAEPGFLGELPSLQEAIEYTGTVTIFSAPHLEGQEPSEWTTDRIEPQQRSHPVEGDRPPVQPARPNTLPEEARRLDDEEAQEHITDLGRPTPPRPPELPDLTVVSQADTDTIPFVEFDEDDSEVVQMATTLIQVSLELTAEATVIARDGMIVGYAGKLPMSDLQDLFDQLTVEWDKANGHDKSRILFATLPETGAEFMVSTRATQSGFTLSLIFSGTRPLHDIRRQSKRLLDALATLPEPDLLEEPPVPTLSTAEVGGRTPIAYLWLPRDPQHDFDASTQKKLRQALDTELKISGWKVGEIQSPDYVYIYGEMPVNLNPRETLRELMTKTASLIQSDSATLWDDSYLILQPGREIQAEEIQTFIHFARR